MVRKPETIQIPFTDDWGLASVPVSVRFVIHCFLLHFAAVSLLAKPLCLQDNAT
jgi:hypothetical protein